MFDTKDINALNPLPIKRLKGKIFFTDGHSRAFIAYQSGFEEIPVYAGRSHRPLSRPPGWHR